MSLSNFRSHMTSANWRNMAQIMYSLPNTSRGNESPRTRTSSVPSLVSSKQWFLSWWLVYMVTLWPLNWMPTAASTTSLSAPPILLKFSYYSRIIFPSKHTNAQVRVNKCNVQLGVLFRHCIRNKKVMRMALKLKWACLLSSDRLCRKVKRDF